ncbi:HEPN domain-containing protein [Dictyoglomus thermophilum]
MEDASTDIICFHCQQAIKKYLKSFLTYVDVKAII